ncbi:hypothetical protein C3L50_02010 [Flavobacterium alvei]|uniref:Transporter n=1 Tax=Flavobacterium alvei TaxID=2080416 RepID=A0A2S5AFU8_9FLAO|nr:hypothetical protein [Flavobacterium alvei]POY41322.1 hypothetical protein C3L50_02010 [Flavobacterium alvei]
MKKIFFIVSFALIVNFSFAQGCSDAGLCSINHAFQSNEKEFRNTIEVAAILGAGESDVKYFSPYISYTKRFNEHYSFTSKVAFSAAKGSFGTKSQFGDAYLIGNYTFKEKNKKQWSTLVGLKFPFNSSNLKINGYSLPMDYQSSLGTMDLFLGTNLHYKKWDFNGAVQIPVINSNKNSYFKEYSGPDDFPSTNLFERKPDALLRATYSIKTTNNKFTIKPNLLFIYHLGEDSFENIFGKRETIAGSDGLTINGNLITAYDINKQNGIELSLATPFVVREVRPDGLTRSFVAGILYKYSF